jgi:hypothetical protein
MGCELPTVVMGIARIVYNTILFAVPIAIVLFGTIDFIKGIVGKKDDELTGGATRFIKRLITGLIVFFILVVVKWVMGFVGENAKTDTTSCLSLIFGNSALPSGNSGNKSNTPSDPTKTSVYDKYTSCTKSCADMPDAAMIAYNGCMNGCSELYLTSYYNITDKDKADCYREESSNISNTGAYEALNSCRSNCNAIPDLNGRESCYDGCVRTWSANYINADTQNKCN